MHHPDHASDQPPPDERTHYTERPSGFGRGAPFVFRHPSQVEKEKEAAAYYLRVVWPEICGEDPQ